MKKTFGKKVLVVLVIAMMVPGTFTACSNGTTPKKEDPLNVTVSFKALGVPSTTTIDFSPSAPLPAGVTYVLTDDKGHIWKSAEAFDGKVSIGDFATAGPVAFTQTFYYNGEEVTGAGSKRTVTITVMTFPSPSFASIAVPDTGSVTLVHP